MTVIGDLIRAIEATQNGLEQARVALPEAMTVVTRAYDLAEGVGGASLSEDIGQLRSAVESEATRLGEMIDNLEWVRRVALAMVDVEGRDARLKQAGERLLPNLRSSGPVRRQREQAQRDRGEQRDRGKQPDRGEQRDRGEKRDRGERGLGLRSRRKRCSVPARRSTFLARKGLWLSQAGMIGWLGVILATEPPRWLGAAGYLVITGLGLWPQLKCRTVGGIPARRSRPDLREGDMVFKIRSKTRINRKTEQAVRKAFGEAVAGDGPELRHAVAEITRRGEEFTEQALALVFRIGRASLLSIHHGDTPSEQQLQIMTRDYVEYEAWSELEYDTTLAYLRALATQTSPREALAVPDQLFAACAIGAWLLSAFIPDEVRWTDFLDGILATLEDQTPPGDSAGDDDATRPAPIRASNRA